MNSIDFTYIILLQITPVAAIHTTSLLERVGNFLKRAQLRSNDFGSILVRIITEFVDKIKLFPNQKTLNILAENITGLVSLFCILNT